MYLQVPGKSIFVLFFKFSTDSIGKAPILPSNSTLKTSSVQNVLLELVKNVWHAGARFKFHKL